ncbi:MAG: DUF1801 domain-containing protein [Candidatus Pacebacteria bacterium]|jgi:hypothetical protein|nr:DUF1801 domain-containing protein [Candidatus Paceibacterota bacterium]MBT3512223.1 DUF1801 domain-containing protein [Candidatus Paceibacterota bacterium]MBT4004547.1 DUF1801 domain-containing protein [Candidatus Paceibacterota bacterium]MBT4359205.1 DUF1801 domain-containing protein [Candidatus Paceibacterota bacterium]MBT4681091.1 DUF1801 domain-containing protein [Candidatus Paceibacterota bacterium]
MQNKELASIFNQVKEEILAYEDMFVSQKANTTKPQYHLWSQKNVEIAGRKRNKVYFAGVIQQKHFVGFYFMPIYADPKKFKKLFSPILLSLLKGKSCFHLTKMTPELKSEIKLALKLGFDEYQNNKWV